MYLEMFLKEKAWCNCCSFRQKEASQKSTLKNLEGAQEVREWVTIASYV